MVPVGGAVVAGWTTEKVNAVAETYCGRASSSQTLNVLITLLEMGKLKYLALMKERKEMYNTLKEELMKFSSEYGEKVLDTPNNPISLALTLNNVQSEDVSMIGSMLFKRGISGTRVVPTEDIKTIANLSFKSNSNGI